MRIGITGITGYVGGALARRAIEEGHEVVGYSRNATPAAVDFGGELRATDYRDADFSGLDALFHLAAEPIFGPWVGGKAERVRRSRVDLTREIRERLVALPAGDRPTVFVSASGVGFYGNRGDDWLPETAEGQTDHYFGQLVHDWESEAAATAEVGIRTVCARLGVVLGKGSPACDLLGLVFKLGAGGRLGSGDQWFSWVEIDDLTRMLLEIAQNESLSGPINCVSPEPVTNRQLTRVLGKILRRPTLIPVPAFVLKLGMRQLSQALLFSQRVQPKVWQDHGFEWQKESAEEALASALG